MPNSEPEVEVVLTVAELDGLPRLNCRGGRVLRQGLQGMRSRQTDREEDDGETEAMLMARREARPPGIRHCKLKYRTRECGEGVRDQCSLVTHRSSVG